MSLPITGRDLRLFQALNEFGILSTGQIGKLFFTGQDRPVVLRRLRKLHGRNLIRHFHGLPRGELVWTLTEKGARGVGSNLAVKTINRNTIEHDLISTEVKMRFDESGIGSNWQSAHSIQRMKKGSVNWDRIPDWLFMLYLKKRNILCALEVELHLKGLKRLVGILESYSIKKDIPFVWYVVPTDSFGMKILDRVPICYARSGQGWLGYSLIDEVLTNIELAKVCTKNGTALIKNFCRVKSDQQVSETKSPVQEEAKP